MALGGSANMAAGLGPDDAAVVVPGAGTAAAAVEPSSLLTEADLNAGRRSRFWPDGTNALVPVTILRPTTKNR